MRGECYLMTDINKNTICQHMKISDKETCKKLQFEFTKESFEKDIDMLETIFFQGTPFKEIGGFGEYVDKEFIRYLQNNYIEMFLITFDKFREPANENDLAIFDDYVDISKSKDPARHRVYWQAHCFFKSKHMSLKLINGKSTLLETENGNAYIRCGEITAERIISEFARSYRLEAFWFFPLFDKTLGNNDNVVNCYAFTLTDAGKKEVYKYLKEVAEKMNNVMKLIIKE